MGFYNLIVSSPKKLSIENSRLAIADENGEVFHYPLEDIDSILIDNVKILLSQALLSAFGEYGIVGYICDGSHMPNTVILPQHTNFHRLKILSMQITFNVPLKKRLWQAIVKQKIENQAECLALAGLRNAADAVGVLSKEVFSGDSTNIEAVAARKYFLALYGDGFSRTQESFINSALNYGYSILRSAIARTLVVHGFEPSLGLWHCSELNNFNLADDLIEPFRPCVDLAVKELSQQCETFSPTVKKQLVALLRADTDSGGEKHYISYAIERLVSSLQKSMTEETVALTLPKLLALRTHRYE